MEMLARPGQQLESHSLQVVTVSFKITAPTLASEYYLNSLKLPCGSSFSSIIAESVTGRRPTLLSLSLSLSLPANLNHFIYQLTFYMNPMPKMNFFWFLKNTYDFFHPVLFLWGTLPVLLIYLCRLARIFWLIFPLGRQLAILGWQIGFRGSSISPLEFKITKIRSTNLLFWISTPCSTKSSLRSPDFESNILARLL